MHNLGKTVLRFRAVIGAVLLLITAFMAYWATHVKIATSFVGLFPENHPYVRLYENYLRYGSAEKVIFEVRVKHGDIFNYDTLNRLQGIQLDTELLPNINHDMVFSLASDLTSYTVSVPGGIDWRNFMFPDVPKTAAELAALRSNVRAHKEQLRTLVSPDFKSAVVEGTFHQTGSQDYTQLFNTIQAIVHRYQDANNTIYVTGEPVIRGYGYYYFPEIRAIFLISIAIMIVALYIGLSDFTSWWVPALTGSFSALWGLGFVGLMGYDFDPLMLVVPLLLTARDISHGVQWQRRYYYLLGKGDIPNAECIILTTNYMFPAGVLAIAVDIAGVIFISFSGIPILDHIARAGSVWLAASLTMVFIFQPVLMSYLPTPRQRRSRLTKHMSFSGLSRIGERFARLGVDPGPARGILIVSAAAFLIWGILSGLHAEIGYLQPGTPLYRPDAKVNKDLAQIEKDFPTDEGWAIVTAPPKSEAFGGQGVPTNSVLNLKVLRMEHYLHNYLLNLPTVRDVRDIADEVVAPSNSLLYNGHPKFVGLPANNTIVYYTIMLFMRMRASGTMDQYLLKNTSCMRIMLTNHTAPTLSSLVDALHTFNQTYFPRHPELKGFNVTYLGGIAGLYAAANDELFRLDLRNIAFVLAASFIFCALAFRSFQAGVLFVIACVLANFGAFIYLRLRHIGLTIDTVPVISLGIGLGVDYGIYTVARIYDEVMEGMPLRDAAILAKLNTGGAVMVTFSIIFLSLIPWFFSPALFHANMSLLLALLMMLNLLAGVMVLPAVLTWSRMRFVQPRQLTSEAPAARSAHGS